MKNCGVKFGNVLQDKKNGRQGQTQHGVDVYGIPFRNNNILEYNAKEKDEYTHAQLTESEVDKGNRKSTFI